MTLALRPYQTDIIDRVREKIRAGVKRVLIVLPTGGGKTALMAHMMRTSTSRGYRSFFCVHRRELVKQSVLTLTDSAGIDVGIVAAGFPSNRHEAAQVCSVPTLARRHKLLLSPHLLAMDEAHHSAAKSWADLIALYPNAVLIGLTATPERLDGAGLGQWFDDMVIGPSVRELIDGGYLCDYRLFAPKGVDLTGVHTVAGDYNKRELNDLMSKSAVVGDCITHYKKHCGGARAIVFAWSIEASEQIARQFNDAGIKAMHLDGKTDDVTRDHATDSFRRGETQVLCNVNLISEGYDVPAAEAMFDLSPTQSLSMFLQRCGRVLRPAPGKREALIFDHSGNSARHGLPDDPREWSLAGRAKKARETDKVPVKQCPLCFATVSAAVTLCRHCGYKFEVQSREIEQVDGELSEIDVERQRRDRKQEQAQAGTVEDLIRIGTLRGYKNPAKWASHVFGARQAKQAARDAETWARGNA